MSIELQKPISPETKLYFFLRSKGVEARESKAMIKTIKEFIRIEAKKLL
jgi:hypothetical protein